MPPGNGRVEREPPADVAAGARQRQLGVESRCGTAQSGVERRVDGDVPESAQHARPFLKREALGVDGEVEDGRLPAGIDLAVERKG